MSTQAFAACSPEAAVDQFAQDVRKGLGGAGQKHLSSTYLYDPLGSALFEAITLLPEYGLTRADARLLRSCAPSLAQVIHGPVRVLELGSGSGRKTEAILHALDTQQYIPVDVSATALEQCVQIYGGEFDVKPIQAAYLDGVTEALQVRRSGERFLLVFAGSTIGNFDQAHAVSFLAAVRDRLQAGDAFLLGADLLKPLPQLLAAYDDSLGATAAFNRNILAHINRTLAADFVPHAYQHEVRFNPVFSRIEMHLRPVRPQIVRIARAALEIQIVPSETIWTESSHKYRLSDLEPMAGASGFRPTAHWVDSEWPFAECLWVAD